MNSMLLKQRVETLLETKSNNYKKKYFVLSTLANSDARKNETIMSEIYSLCETLNNSPHGRGGLGLANSLHEGAAGRFAQGAI